MSVDRGRVDEICDVALQRSPELREAYPVTVTAGKPQTATPVRLFDLKGFLLDESAYEISRDDRFFMIKRERHTATQLNLVQNWFAELRSR